MKNCQFCGEQIQDSAIRCRFCSADLAAAESAAKNAEREMAVTTAAGVFIGLIGAALFAFVGYKALMIRDYKSTGISAAFAVAFLLFAPKGWSLGSTVGKQDKRSTLIIASSQNELMKEQLALEYGPPLFIVGAVFFLMAVGLCFLVPVGQVFNGRPSTSDASVAATAQSQVESTPVVTTASVPAPAATANKTASETGKAEDTNAPSTANETAATPQIQQTQSSAEEAPAPQADTATAVSTVHENAVKTSESQSMAPAATPVQASFDCAKAASRIEVLICSTSQTAEADAQLAKTYSAARARARDANALKADQRQWLSTERNVCEDAACLMTVTEARIKRLSSM